MELDYQIRISSLGSIHGISDQCHIGLYPNEPSIGSLTVNMTVIVRVPDFFNRNKIFSGGDLSHYQVPHCIRVFFYFDSFVFIHHNYQFYFELYTYCNIFNIYLSLNLNLVSYLLFYMKLLNYLFFNMFGSVLGCCELTGVSLLWPWLIKWK